MSGPKITALESRVDALEKKLAAMEELLNAKNTTTNTTTITTKDSKPDKEHVKRGPNAWSLFVKHVTADMKKAAPDTKLQLPQIASEAKKRKDAGEYDEAHWKAEVEKLKTSD